MTNDCNEALLANLAAAVAGQQLIIDRLLRAAPGGVARDLELQQVAQDVSGLLAVTRHLLTAGPPSEAHGDD